MIVESDWNDDENDELMIEANMNKMINKLRIVGKRFLMILIL